MYIVRLIYVIIAKKFVILSIYSLKGNQILERNQQMGQTSQAITWTKNSKISAKPNKQKQKIIQRAPQRCV